MDRTGAEFTQRFIVPLRAVALVDGEAVLRVDRVLLEHEAVARDLRKDRRRRDIRAAAVALDDRAHGDVAEIRLTVAVDERKVGLLPELLNGAAHGKKRRLQNVELVDLLLACKGDAIGQRLRRAREAAGFSRADLRAHGSKMFVSDVYHYEAGRYQFPVEKLMDFCNLYHADPDVILGYSTPGWQNCKVDTAELPDGALCLVLIRDPVTPAFVTARVARWKGNAFVSAVNETSRISGDIAGFVRLPEPPDGCSFSVEVVPK